MKLVIDTNIIFSALVKSGLARELILNKNFELITPAFTLSEIYKYKKTICKKAKINKEEFDILIQTLFKYIKIINPSLYLIYINKAKLLITDKKIFLFWPAHYYLIVQSGVMISILNSKKL